MHKKVREIEFQKIMNLLKEYDNERVYNKIHIIPKSDDLYAQLEKYVDVQSLNRKSVLGIDIYRYGMYKHMKQVLIPSLFKLLFDKTINLCLNSNQFVFQNYTKEQIEKAFISTGDGGFVILDTPLHTLLFNINFEMLVRAYNSYHFYPKLRDVIGSISLRYAITYDIIYYFENNFYGTAIILNSRILEKDSLNRCLIDQDTYNWFLFNIDGIENLQIITINEIANIYEFQDYDKKYMTQGENEIINSKTTRYSGIINSDISKIGQINVKESLLNIYNLHLQVTLKASSTTSKIKRVITVSLGNLNTSGI